MLPQSLTPTKIVAAKNWPPQSFDATKLVTAELDTMELAAAEFDATKLVTAELDTKKFVAAEFNVTKLVHRVRHHIIGRRI